MGRGIENAVDLYCVCEGLCMKVGFCEFGTERRCSIGFGSEAFWLNRQALLLGKLHSTSMCWIQALVDSVQLRSTQKKGNGMIATPQWQLPPLISNPLPILSSLGSMRRHTKE